MGSSIILNTVCNKIGANSDIIFFFKVARDDLEKENEKLISSNGVGNVSSLLGKSESDIELIANKIGVDFYRIKERSDGLQRIIK